MSFVITNACAGVCDQACLDVCPVDCIAGPLSREEIEAVPKEERAARLGTLQLYIDPQDCTSCGACEPECPVAAICDEDVLPRHLVGAIAESAAFFERRRGGAK